MQLVTVGIITISIIGISYFIALGVINYTYYKYYYSGRR